MNFIITYAQMLGLNIMLIVLTSTSPLTSFVTYLVLCIFSLGVSVVSLTLFKSVLTGKHDIPHEWQFIPHNFPKENKVTYICTTLIHIGLSTFLLHSVLLPILMVLILGIRIYNCNLFEKVLLCQK